MKRTKINEKEAGIGPYFFKKTFNNKQFKYLSHITRAILGEKDITYFLFLFESNLVKVETSRRRMDSDTSHYVGECSLLRAKVALPSNALE